MSEPCEHAWAQIVRRVCKALLGDSVDTYSECACGAILHVYTFDPYCIRHEHVHAAGTKEAYWTKAYALGMKTILDDLNVDACTFVPEMQGK